MGTAPSILILNPPYTCDGKCGDGVICGHITYWHGYCKSPGKREIVLTELKEQAKSS